MKLYTEADMIRMYNAGYGTAFTGYGNADIALERFTPIELPGDEEIDKKANKFKFELNKTFFKEGAKWVIGQIKEQNK